MKITPGTVIRDNSWGENLSGTPHRSLRVERASQGYAHCTEISSLRPATRVRLDRIHTDGKPRKSGFSVVTWGPQE